MRKRIEIWLLWLVVYITRGRNVSRSPYISRRDNNKLWSIHEQVEGIIRRMEDDYELERRLYEAESSRGIFMMHDPKGGFVCNTVLGQEQMSESARMSATKAVAGNSWFDGWRPKCMQTEVPCSGPYMDYRSFGYRCPECQNMVGHNCERLAESPLNHRVDWGVTRR